MGGGEGGEGEEEEEVEERTRRRALSREVWKKVMKGLSKTKKPAEPDSIG